MGALSLILWSLILLCTVKYVCFILLADADGEGGTFALLTLIRKGMLSYARGKPFLAEAVKKKRIADGLDMKALAESPRASPNGSEEKMDDDLSSEIADGAPSDSSSSSNLTLWQRIGAWCFCRLDGCLTIISFIAAGMLMGDGVLTPAISILSAVEGIAVVQPSLQASVMPISLLIILLLFLGQRFGTAKVSVVFAPIMLVWFIVLAILGAWNIARYPGVLGALSPHYGIMFFVRRGTTAWLQLGSVVLCVTGTEAMYADLGHFGSKAVRLSWIGVVFPSLILTYAGQAALLVQDPSAVDNTFFRSIPSGIYVPMLILATAATVIASQALISGSFSLISAAIKLNFLPHLRLKHTSEGQEGQIYLLSVNYALMISTVVVVLVFQKSSALANAYGLAVTFVMIITTCMYTCVMIFLWRSSPWLIIAWNVVFLTIDLGFCSANIVKIFSGGYLPLIFASFVTVFMFTWHWGRQQVKRYAQPKEVRNKWIRDPRSDDDGAGTALLAHLAKKDHHAANPSSQQTEVDEDLRLMQALAATQPVSSASHLAQSSSPSPLLPLVSHMSCIGIFLTSSEERIPHGAWQLLARLHSFPEKCIFLTIHFTQAPFVDPSKRTAIRTVFTEKLGREKFKEWSSANGAEEEISPASPLDRFELYRVVVSYGFAEVRVSMSDIISELFPKLEAMHVVEERARSGINDSLVQAEDEENPFDSIAGSSLLHSDISPFRLSASVSRSLPRTAAASSPSALADLVDKAEREQAETHPITFFLSSETLIPAADAAAETHGLSTSPSAELSSIALDTSPSPTGPVTARGSSIPGLSHLARWMELAAQRTLITAYNFVSVQKRHCTIVSRFTCPICGCLLRTMLLSFCTDPTQQRLRGRLLPNPLGPDRGDGCTHPAAIITTSSHFDGRSSSERYYCFRHYPNPIHCHRSVTHRRPSGVQDAHTEAAKNARSYHSESHDCTEVETR